MSTQTEKEISRLKQINKDLLEACKALLDDLAETASVSVEEFCANSEVGAQARDAMAKTEGETNEQSD